MFSFYLDRKQIKMKFLLVVLLIPISIALQSQDFLSLEYEIETKTCPEDTSITFTGIKNWDIFQTLDNSPNGERINNCENIDFANIGRFILPLKNIDPDRSIFIKNENPLNKKIDPNRIFEAYTSSLILNEGEFIKEDPQGRVNKILVDVDGIGEFGDTIENNFQVQSDINIQSNRITLRDCVITEKQDSQTVNEICFVLEARDFSDSSVLIIPRFFMQTYPWGDPFFMNSIVRNIYLENGIYKPHPWETFSIASHASTSVYHLTPGDPSPDNMHYYNIQVEDSTTQHTIDLDLDNDYSLIFQRYTQIRGALVAGEDSLRHKFNINLEGGSICFQFAIDFITEEDNEFRYLSGNVNFTALNACMQFQGGSKLRIMENARFHFGQNGVGLLSLKPGSEVVIEDGAELYMDGNILLSGYRDSESIKIELGPGQKLTFSPNAHIYPLIDEFYFKQIDVYLKGGELDIQHLDEQSLGRLNIIYETDNQDSETVHVFPNPSSDFIAIENSNYPNSVKIALVNIKGQTVISKEGNTQYLNLDVRSLENGSYILTGEGIASQKIIIAH